MTRRVQELRVLTVKEMCNLIFSVRHAICLATVI